MSKFQNEIPKLSGVSYESTFILRGRSGKVRYTSRRVIYAVEVRNAAEEDCSRDGYGYDIIKMAGSSRMRTAQDRVTWDSLEEALTCESVLATKLLPRIKFALHFFARNKILFLYEKTFECKTLMGHVTYKKPRVSAIIP